MVLDLNGCNNYVRKKIKLYLFIYLLQAV